MGRQSLHTERRRVDNRLVQATLALNRAELRRYLERIGDRWRLEGAYLGGPAVHGGSADAHDAPAEPAFTVVLVSDALDAVPWLERVYVATSLWDALEMRGRADVHCYTRAEFDRKRDAVPTVRDAVWHGLDLLVFI